ncbi:hypothetical protein DMENIID0001_068920 [Sergentomyia squamirostris]
MNSNYAPVLNPRGRPPAVMNPSLCQFHVVSVALFWMTDWDEDGVKLTTSFRQAKFASAEKRRLLTPKKRVQFWR